MHRNILFLVLFIWLLESALGQEGRIYGGYQTDIMKAPFMAQVIVVHQKPVPGAKLDSEQCGGSILKTNLIITAGHCIRNSSTGEIYGPDRYFVYVGSTTAQGGDLHTVKKVNLHPKYKGGGDNHFFHDIGILELSDHISLDDTKQLVTIAMKGDKPKAGSDAHVCGWGKNPDHPNDNRLYCVFLKIISAQKCHNELAGGDVKEIDQHQICATGKKKAHCQGDSGGPLIDATTKRQIGVVSYGAKDCTLSKPSIFTRVTDNLDFIQGIISNAEAMSDSKCME